MTIAKPEMQCNAGIYMFDWPDINVKARVERIRENSHHELSGEVSVWTKQPGQDELLEMTRLNLLASRTRNELAKTLTERVNHLDWVSIVKYACVMTINDYRQGEPVVFIGDEPETMKATYCVEPILEEGEPTTLFAPGGTGKSYLADYIAVLVQYGVAGLGRWIPRQGNVLFLDWEASNNEHRRRVWAAKHGLGIQSDDRIAYRFCTQPLAADIAEIQRLVLDHDIYLVVVDSQVAACGGDVERAEAANQFYNALRSLRRTSLTLDHVTKNADPNNRTPFGSVFKWNRARSIFELRSTQEPDENTLELGLYHRKHNEGQLLGPLGIKVSFTMDDDVLKEVAFARCDIAANPELAKGLSLWKRIAAELKAGAATTADLAAVFDTTEGNIRSQIHKHKDVFVKLDEHSWGLAYHD